MARSDPAPPAIGIAIEAALAAASARRRALETPSLAGVWDLIATAHHRRASCLLERGVDRGNTGFCACPLLHYRGVSNFTTRGTAMAEDVRVTNFPKDGSPERVAYELYNSMTNFLPDGKQGVDWIAQRIELFIQCRRAVTGLGAIDLSKLK